ncbi:MAG: arylsulfotransferase family protein [Thermoanaerobaculia bacterium]
MPKALRALLKAFLAGALIAGLFAWGFAVERYKVFPIGLIREVRARLGVPGWPVDIQSKSPAAAGLASIPYLHGQYDANAKASGVLEDGREAFPGLNFFSTLGSGDAFLIDDGGHSLWRWSLKRYFEPSELKAADDFGFPHLFPNGDVLAYVAEKALFKLDRESGVVWKYPARVHHDAFVAGDGRIWTLRHVFQSVPAIDPRYTCQLDEIDVLSPEGRRERSIALLPILEKSPYAFLLPRTAGLPLPADTTTVDVLHSNHIEVFDGSLAAISPFYRRGNFLISLRNLNSIAIVDGETLKVLWLWGPTNLTLQHHPTILANGDILLFDNGTKISAVVEVDPRTNAVVWRYAPLKGFFSYIRGACQRLPNGDTLITLSMPGYALEVTPAGKTVWKFANPAVSPAGIRDSIYRMTRFSPAGLPFVSSIPPRS